MCNSHNIHTGLHKNLHCGVWCIQGGSWSNFITGWASHCFRESEAPTTWAVIFHIWQRDASHHACIGQISTVLGRQQVLGEDWSQQSSSLHGLARPQWQATEMDQQGAGLWLRYRVCMGKAQCGGWCSISKTSWVISHEHLPWLEGLVVGEVLQRSVGMWDSGGCPHWWALQGDGWRHILQRAHIFVGGFTVEGEDPPCISWFSIIRAPGVPKDIHDGQRAFHVERPQGGCTEICAGVWGLPEE